MVTLRGWTRSRTALSNTVTFGQMGGIHVTDPISKYTPPAVERREDVAGLLHFQKGSYGPPVVEQRPTFCCEACRCPRRMPRATPRLILARPTKEENRVELRCRERRALGAGRRQGDAHRPGLERAGHAEPGRIADLADPRRRPRSGRPAGRGRERRPFPKSTSRRPPRTSKYSSMNSCASASCRPRPDERLAVVSLQLNGVGKQYSARRGTCGRSCASRPRRRSTPSTTSPSTSGPVRSSGSSARTGPGKTTLLEDHQHVARAVGRFGARSTTSTCWPTRAQPRERLGIVLNGERATYWRLDGRQNLEFFGVLAGLPLPEARREGDRAPGAARSRRS